jgi:hypothetical protein
MNTEEVEALLGQQPGQASAEELAIPPFDQVTHFSRLAIFHTTLS